MDTAERLQLSAAVLRKARELGADAAGITDFEEVREYPSYSFDARIPQTEEEQKRGSLRAGEAAWPEDGRSVIVTVLSHPEDQPELDWRHENQSPPGDRKLADLNRELIRWLEENYQGINTFHVPYFIEKGGLYLKDAAVMAGLGTIGRSNLFISPEYGPRVRLRAVVINQELPPTGPLAFDPCSDCAGYCLKECPQDALEEIIYTPEEMGQQVLPGLNGSYSRQKCSRQMEKDKENTRLFKHCRICEFSCPVGK